MLIRNSCALLRLVGALLLPALSALPTAAHEVAYTPPVISSAEVMTATGTVGVLTVRNSLTGTTLRYYGLTVDHGASYALNGDGLGALVDGSRINVIGTRAGNVFNVTLFSGIAPSAATTQVSARALVQRSVTGTLAVYHKDFFAEGRGEYGLAVRDAAGQITLLSVPVIPDSLAIGMTIAVDGTLAADGSSLDVTSIIILAPPPNVDTVTGAAVTNTVLVIPIRFADTPAGDPFNGAAINTEFQTHVAPYYSETSYGQQLLNITTACTSTPVPAGCASRIDANGWLISA